MKYRPTLNDQPGTNWFDTKSMLLYFVIKGDGEFVIKTQNVILVSMMYKVFNFESNGYFEHLVFLKKKMKIQARSFFEIASNFLKLVKCFT